MTAAVARSQRAHNRKTTVSRRASTASRATSSNPANMVRPQLKVLDQQASRRRARRRNLAMTVFIVVIIGFFAAALAQAQLVANQHELDVLHTKVAEAEADRARLERQVEESSAPSAIIHRAQEIGMVRANEPIYLAATTSAPAITTISSIGSATATTKALRGAEAEIDVAHAAFQGDDQMAASFSHPETASQSMADRGVTVSEVASVAGIRAVATGVGTG